MKKTYLLTKIIEFFGLPQAGKSTTISAIMEYFISQGINAEIIKEQASINPITDKLHPMFNLWTATSFIKNYIEVCNRKSRFLVADRGILDALIWGYYLGKDFPEYEEIKSLASLHFLRNNLIVGYFFYADIDLIINRRLLVEPHEGTIVNKVILSGYLKSFYEIRNKLDFPIVLVNTTSRSIDEMIMYVKNDLLLRLK